MTEATELKEVSRALKAVAQQLAALAERLDQASPEERAHIEAEVERTLQVLRGAEVKEEGEVVTEHVPTAAGRAEAERLQREVLRELARGGPALPLELAAALLTSPQRLRTVLEEMQRLGLVEVRSMREGDLIRLTSQGRATAKRLGLV